MSVSFPVGNIFLRFKKIIIKIIKKTKITRLTVPVAL